jgi:hypothetical protein
VEAQGGSFFFAYDAQTVSNRDICLSKIDGDGGLAWVRCYGDSDDEFLSDMIVLPDSGLLLLGTRVSAGSGGADVYLIRVRAEDPSSARNVVSRGLSWCLSSYPNPFNPNTTIAFTLDKPERVTLVVYDLNGRQVETLIDGALERGEHKLNFDGHALPSGLYFARMQTASGSTRTVKLALVK